jgi:hypothetical protein
MIRLLSDADAVLPLIDPSRLFVPTVRKALYTTAPEFAQSSGMALLRILKQIDQSANINVLVKEIRSGTGSNTPMSRMVQKAPQRARKVLLFVGEATPTTPAAFVIQAPRSLCRSCSITSKSNNTTAQRMKLLWEEWRMRCFPIFGSP